MWNMDSEARVDGNRRIGEIAAVANLTVRTLHYYEEIGLLVPSGRSEAGHRLYDDGDVERLYRICLLRSLGLPLAEIGRALDDPAWDLRSSIGEHLRRLEKRIDREVRVRGRLSHLLGSTDTKASGRAATLIEIIEEMNMLEATLERRISSLVYADLEEAYHYLVRVYGLGPGELSRDDERHVVHAELQAGDGAVWLHPESNEFQLASPESVGAATSGVVVLVDDVDAHFEHAKEQGAKIVYDPIDQPYGYREYGARDLEGHLWSFMKPLSRADTKGPSGSAT